jgi:hypothetical protein
MHACVGWLALAYTDVELLSWALVSLVQGLHRQSFTVHVNVGPFPVISRVSQLIFACRVNAKLAPPRIQLMATGVHTMQEISCSTCSSYLGWKILQARNRSEKWKEGCCLLELESLAEAVL